MTSETGDVEHMPTLGPEVVASAGPALEALMQLCHDGAPLMALRTVSSSFCSASERVGRTSSLPKWPLLLMITADDFVSQHRPCEPEFVIEFGHAATASCSYAVYGDAKEDVQWHSEDLPQSQAADIIRKLGRLHHLFGAENQLWQLPKLQRRATLNLHMTPEEYAWSSMQVAMQCDPRASKRLVLLDARDKIILKHTFLDPDYVLPPAGRGAFRKVDKKGLHCDRVHRWLVRQLRDLCGNPNVVADSCHIVWQPPLPVGPARGVPTACGVSWQLPDIFVD